MIQSLKQKYGFEKVLRVIKILETEKQNWLKFQKNEKEKLIEKKLKERR